MYKLNHIFVISMALLILNDNVNAEPHAEISKSQFEDEIFDFAIVPEFETIEYKSKYLASIRLIEDDGVFGKGHICSGALIAPSVVLTVGHCLFNYEQNLAIHPAEIRIVLGTLNRYMRTKHTLVYGVTHIYRPKTFEPHILRDNIAIVMLDSDVPELHPTVMATSLYTAQLDNFNINDNLPLAYEVIGWNDLGVQKETLQQHQLTEAAEVSCCTNDNKNFYESANFCVQYKQSICHKDAGAPLLHANKLAGLNVFSGNQICNKQTHPAVFVNVSNYEKWIYEQIGDGKNHNSSFFGILGFTLFTIYTLRATNLLKF